MKRRRAGFGKEKRGMGENARQRQLKGNDNVNGRRERRLSGDAIRAALGTAPRAAGFCRG